jgi:hypothetical protein
MSGWERDFEHEPWNEKNGSYDLRMKNITALLVLAALTSSCSGLRESDDSFSAHAESFRIIGFAIPGEDDAAAMALVPEGATVTTIHSTPADWTSFFGVLNNILGFSITTVSGTK